jgi:hypothetical protein
MGEHVSGAEVIPPVTGIKQIFPVIFLIIRFLFKHINQNLLILRPTTFK